MSAKLCDPNSLAFGRYQWSLEILGKSPERSQNLNQSLEEKTFHLMEISAWHIVGPQSVSVIFGQSCWTKTWRCIWAKWISSNIIVQNPIPPFPYLPFDTPYRHSQGKAFQVIPFPLPGEGEAWAWGRSRKALLPQRTWSLQPLSITTTWK